MKYYQYPLRTGQTVVSPVDLSYAFGATNTIDLNCIKPADSRRISILADESMADVVTELSEGKVWRLPAIAIHQPATNEPSAQNYCVTHKGKIYIKDGKRYTLLDNLLETASRDELLFIIQNIAYQAAICQAALSIQHSTDMANRELQLGEVTDHAV